LIPKLETNKSFGRYGRKWEYNIKMYLNKVRGCELDTTDSE